MDSGSRRLVAAASGSSSRPQILVIYPPLKGRLLKNYPDTTICRSEAHPINYRLCTQRTFSAVSKGGGLAWPRGHPLFRHVDTGADTIGRMTQWTSCKRPARKGYAKSQSQRRRSLSPCPIWHVDRHSFSRGGVDLTRRPGETAAEANVVRPTPIDRQLIEQVYHRSVFLAIGSGKLLWAKAAQAWRFLPPLKLVGYRA